MTTVSQPFLRSISQGACLLTSSLFRLGFNHRHKQRVGAVGRGMDLGPSRRWRTSKVDVALRDAPHHVRRRLSARCRVSAMIDGCKGGNMGIRGCHARIRFAFVRFCPLLLYDVTCSTRDTFHCAFVRTVPGSQLCFTRFVSLLGYVTGVRLRWCWRWRQTSSARSTSRPIMGCSISVSQHSSG